MKFKNMTHKDLIDYNNQFAEKHDLTRKQHSNEVRKELQELHEEYYRRKRECEDFNVKPFYVRVEK